MWDPPPYVGAYKWFAIGSLETVQKYLFRTINLFNLSEERAAEARGLG